MKHLTPLSSTPRQAVSAVEFSAMLTLFASTVAQLNNAINFSLTLLGLPDDVQGAKSGGE